MNVFVYHAQDHEGKMLAELVRRLDPTQSFQFLPVEGPHSMMRLHKFLDVHNLSVQTVSLPLVVVVRDTSGSAVHTHRLVHGEALAEWFQGILRGVMEAGPVALNSLKEAVFTHLSSTTISAVSLCVRSMMAAQNQPPHDDVGGAAGGSPAEATPPPPMPPTPTTAPAPPPPPTPTTPPPPQRVGPKAARSRVGASGGHDPTSESIVVAPDGGAGVESWTEEATVPEPRKDKTVNIADAMGHAKQRDSSQARIR